MRPTERPFEAVDINICTTRIHRPTTARNRTRVHRSHSEYVALFLAETQSKGFVNVQFEGPVR